MKKEQLVDEVLKQENIQIGRKDIPNWAQRDLEQAHVCVGTLKRNIPRLREAESEFKKMDKKDFSGRNRAMSLLKYLEYSIQECEKTLAPWLKYK